MSAEFFFGCVAVIGMIMTFCGLLVNLSAMGKGRTTKAERWSLAATILGACMFFAGFFVAMALRAPT